MQTALQVVLFVLATIVPGAVIGGAYRLKKHFPNGKLAWKYVVLTFLLWMAALDAFFAVGGYGMSLYAEKAQEEFESVYWTIGLIAALPLPAAFLLTINMTDKTATTEENL